MRKGCDGEEKWKRMVKIMVHSDLEKDVDSPQAENSELNNVPKIA